MHRTRSIVPLLVVLATSACVRPSTESPADSGFCSWTPNALHPCVATCAEAATNWIDRGSPQRTPADERDAAIAELEATCERDQWPAGGRRCMTRVDVTMSCESSMGAYAAGIPHYDELLASARVEEAAQAERAAEEERAAAEEEERLMEEMEDEMGDGSDSE